jgi:hypothetical protein
MSPMCIGGRGVAERSVLYIIWVMMGSIPRWLLINEGYRRVQTMRIRRIDGFWRCQEVAKAVCWDQEVPSKSNQPCSSSTYDYRY